MSESTCKTCRSRARAMLRPQPEQWIPELDEEVFLPNRSPFLNTSRGVVKLLLGWGMAEVRYTVNGTIKRCKLLLSDLRPTCRRLVWKGREQVFQNFKPKRREWRFDKRYGREVIVDCEHQPKERE